jgi:predicted negative regulator of RcsB-dependent stress response
MKRRERRKLKEDELVSTLTKLTRFARKHQKEMYFFIVIIIIALLIFSGYSYYKNVNYKKKSEIVKQIIELSSNLGKQGNDTYRIKRLEELASNKGISRIAGIFLASYYIEKGELDKAEKQLEKFPKKPKDFFYYQTQVLKSEVYFIRGKHEKAVNILLKIEEEKPKDFILDYVLYKIGQCYEKMGKSNDAITYYQKLQNDYPQSFYALNASQKIRYLK